MFRLYENVYVGHKKLWINIHMYDIKWEKCFKFIYMNITVVVKNIIFRGHIRLINFDLCQFTQMIVNKFHSDLQ